MLMFCPNCHNMLFIEEALFNEQIDEQNLVSNYQFSCHTCPYILPVTKVMTRRQYPELKNVDDVLGGSKAWENVDSTQTTCPKCEGNKAYFMQIQTRSADEPMTTFYKCCNAECNHQWRE